MKVLWLLDPAIEKLGQDWYHTTLISQLQHLVDSRFFYSDLEYPDRPRYEQDCFAGCVDPEYQHAFRKELESYDSVDIVITNSPNTIVREIFPRVLNLTVGLYSRTGGFPVSYGLDPWGLYSESLLYRAPGLGLQDHDRALEYRTRMADIAWIPHGKFLFAFNSEYWPWQIQKLPCTQVQYFNQYLEQHGDVIWTSKPGFENGSRQHHFDYDYLDRLPQHLRRREDSSLLVPGARGIWASHSTLGFQAALWGVPISSPSLFRDWTGDQVGTVGALLDLVWFHDSREFRDRLERLTAWPARSRDIIGS